MRKRTSGFLLASMLLLGAACKDPASSSSSSSSGSGSSTDSKPQSASGAGAEKSAADLDPAKLTEKAPEVFKAKFATSKGDIVVEVHRDWAPNGADRFYNLAKSGFYNENRFFRAVEGFMVQFGLHGQGAVNQKWNGATIPDDPVKQSNKRGFVTFAMRGLGGTRTTQIFINTVDNARLDGMGFAPFGQVVQGMEVVDSLYKGYGEGAPRGQGPDQMQIQTRGNEYLKASFPQLDWVKTVSIVP